MRILFLLVLLAGCTARPTPEASGGTVSGVVRSVDMSPMAYDGDGVIEVATDAGRTVRVLIPARMNLCEAQGLTIVGDVQIGDRVEVVGSVDTDGSIRPCADASHRLTRLQR